ncbi:MAG: hypothetical protein KBS59_07070, partial [Clostridiales bacterium]|nr:hypothetical protein [Clostridiales bacterium]
LLDEIGTASVMLIGGLCTALCGILYVIVLGRNVGGSKKKSKRRRGTNAEDYIKRDANGNMYITDPVTGERRVYEIDEKGLYKNLNTGTVYTEEELISMLNARLRTVTVQKKKKPSAKAQKKVPESKEKSSKEKGRYERKSNDAQSLSADLESDIFDSSMRDISEKETLGKCYAPRLEDAYANDKRVSCAIAMAGFDSITDINFDKLEKAGFEITKKLGTKEIEQACDENKVRLSAEDLEKCIASGLTEESVGAMKHIDALACDNIRKAERILSLDDDLKDLASIEPLEWTIDTRQKSL